MKSFIFYITNNGFPRYLYIILAVLQRIVKDFLGKNYRFVIFLTNRNVLPVILNSVFDQLYPICSCFPLLFLQKMHDFTTVHFLFLMFLFHILLNF